MARRTLTMRKPNRSKAGKSSQPKPNPRSGGTDRPMTENAGKVPGTRPGNHA